MQKIFGVYDMIGETCVMVFLAVSDEDALRQMRLSFSRNRPQGVDGMVVVCLGDATDRRIISTVVDLLPLPEREAELKDAEQKGYARGVSELEARYGRMLDDLKEVWTSRKSWLPWKQK